MGLRFGTFSADLLVETEVLDQLSIHVENEGKCYLWLLFCFCYVNDDQIPFGPVAAAFDSKWPR